MKSVIYIFEEIIKGKSNTTIMTLIEKRCLLAIYESSGFVLSFFGIPTNGATKIPEIVSHFLKFFHPRGT